MTSEIVKLIKPTALFKESYLEALKEFQEEKLPWVVNLNIADLRNNFEKFIEAQLNKQTLWTKDSPVDVTELWAILNETYVGRISIRHKLNHDLEIMGGHIGYDTRPSYRGRGIATSMLRQALPIAKQLGISKVLITCDDNNLASIKIIEKNGGVLKDTKPLNEGGPLKRYYWILT